MKNVKLPMLALGMLALGALGSIGIQAFAQTPTTSGSNSNTVQSTKKHAHAPMGNDGIVSSINGTTIMMAEEADEGGAVYTVNATGATVTKDGAASTLASVGVGDKIFVKGTVNGTSVTATDIMDGHKKGGFGGHWNKNHAPDQKDANGNDIETNDGPGNK
jgi:hypothetical protein